MNRLTEAISDSAPYLYLARNTGRRPVAQMKTDSDKQARMCLRVGAIVFVR